VKKILVDTQLSNYDTYGTFVLEADSGWQMCMGRIRELLKLNPDLSIDILGPNVSTHRAFDHGQVITHPFNINPDIWGTYGPSGNCRLQYVEHEVIPNALATRYDFNWKSLNRTLSLNQHRNGSEPKYDAVYVNDPMRFRALKALFHVAGGYSPKFFVHSHFIDDPACPKFPVEASLWLGQVEAAIRADWNFWQCQNSLDTFEREMRKQFLPHVVDDVLRKSSPWDDGYSMEEINSPVNMHNVRFDIAKLRRAVDGKMVIFVPNRIGGRGRSSDYTNCGKFMFDILPEIRKRRNDFVVIAGNPSQKFLNSELQTECGENGYVSLVPDALNRDEYRFIVKEFVDLVVSLYDQDTYGGTASRECIDLGCVPLWLDNYEYTSIAKEAKCDDFVLARTDFSDIVDVADRLMTMIINEDPSIELASSRLQNVVRKRCSYESSTVAAAKLMGLI
jgi:hypothetical protein